MELLQIHWRLLAQKEIDSLYDTMYDDDCECILDLGNKHYTLLAPDGEFTKMIKPVFIQFLGVSDFWSEYCLDIGEEILTNDVKEYIIDHINKEINFKFEIKNIIDFRPREAPTDGEFLLVFHVDGFRCNIPEDPEEWDMTIECLGVLEDHVKLVKEK